MVSELTLLISLNVSVYLPSSVVASTQATSTLQRHFTTFHSLSPGVVLLRAFPTLLRGIWCEWRRGGLKDSSWKFLPSLIDGRFRSNGSERDCQGLHMCSQLHMPSDGVFEVAVPWAPRLSVIPVIGLQWRTPSLSPSFFHWAQKSANSQVALARVVVKFTHAVLKNSHNMQPFGRNLEPCTQYL